METTEDAKILAYGTEEKQTKADSSAKEEKEGGPEW
jgi:hypothetical protein